MARAYADVLREVQGGDLYDEATAALAELVAAVLETRKSGTLTLSLTITPNGENSVRLAGDLKAKPPKLPRGESLFFVTNGDTLTRDNPRQEDMFRPRAVDVAVAEDEAAPKGRKVRGYDD